MNRKQLLDNRKGGVIQRFARFTGDTGSPEVQVSARARAPLPRPEAGAAGPPTTLPRPPLVHHRGLRVGRASLPPHQTHHVYPAPFSRLSPPPLAPLNHAP